MLVFSYYFNYYSFIPQEKPYGGIYVTYSF